MEATLVIPAPSIAIAVIGLAALIVRLQDNARLVFATRRRMLLALFTDKALPRHAKTMQDITLYPLPYPEIPMLRFLVPPVLLILPLLASAEVPNLEPGEWEYTHTTRMEGMPQMEGMPGMSDEVETTRECVTQQDIERGEDIIEAPEECSVDHVDVHRDGAQFAMTCTDPQGGTATMNGDMRFMGTRSDSTMTTEIESPMGPITVIMEMKGERIGDC